MIYRQFEPSIAKGFVYQSNAPSSTLKFIDIFKNVPKSIKIQSA